MTENEKTVRDLSFKTNFLMDFDGDGFYSIYAWN